MILRIKFYSFLLLTLLLLAACGGGSGGGSSNDSPPANPLPSDSGDVLSTGTYVNGTESWTYQNLRLPNRTGGYAYAQFFQANATGPRPVIVMTKPYLGINWTGEAVDTRWSDQYNTYVTAGGVPPMCAPDVDGPDYDSATSSTTCYTLSNTPQIGNEAFIYLLNKFSVLVVYGRFYAGGNVANDIEDMVAGLRFLGTRTEIDAKRIGMVGGSWGGFETLYATLNAPANVRPAVAAPMFPVTDFFGLVDFINMDLPGLVNDSAILAKYNAFYDPYLRRFFDSTGKPPNTDYSGYTLSDLTALVNTPMLIPHDDGDTILPAKFSHNFANANSALVEGFWYKRLDKAPWKTVITEHGQIGNFILVPAYYTFTTAYLLGRLNNTGQSLIIPYGQQDMQIFFNDILAYQRQTPPRDVSWLVPRLVEMSDSSISMYDLTAGNSTPTSSGANYVAQSLNSVWGTTLTAATVQQYLLGTGIPPP